MKTRRLFIALGPVMRRQLLVTFLAGLLPVAAVAAGETVPCPQKKAGQWYRFARTDSYNNRTEQLTKIGSVEGDRLLVTENGEALITDKMHNWHRVGERMATPKYYSRIECPFSLGETRIYKDVDWDGFARGSKVRGTITLTVDPEFVRLTVKAGSFKVIKIISDNAYEWTPPEPNTSLYGWPGLFTGRAQLVSYYAPEIGIWVKSEYTMTQALPSGRIRDRLELLEYSLDD